MNDREENVNCDSMTESFLNDLKTAVDHFLMTSLIKQLILDRQRAYHTGNKELWKHLRN